MPKPDLSHILKTPWIYKMLNKKGVIIYVGKSVNLKSRVSSYFRKNADLNFAKKQMVKQVDKIEIIETLNETEALVLEINLIKRFSPKYNVLMKDDKNLTYICVTSEIIPRVIKVRNKRIRWEYFWPYTTTFNITALLKVLYKIFRIRNCRIKFEKNSKSVENKVLDKVLKKVDSKENENTNDFNLKISNFAWKSTPCMDYYIWVCSAPCILRLKNILEYKKDISNLIKFLKWDISTVLNNLNIDLNKEIQSLNFEKAWEIRDSIKAIKELNERQIARDSVSWNHDWIVFLEKYWKLFAWKAEIRDWNLIWMYNTEIINKLELDREELVKIFFEQKYTSCQSVFFKWDNSLNNTLNNFYKKEKKEKKNKSKITILINENAKFIKKITKKLDLKIENPEIWSKSDLLNRVRLNLLRFAYDQEMNTLTKRTLTKKAHNSLLTWLGFKELKQKEIIFECYDISHTAWRFTVASRSVLLNWKKTTSKYKRYKIKDLPDWKIDDYESMREVMRRRVLEWIEKNNFPDLIVIDWWKWQLSACLESIEKTFLNKNFKLTILDNLEISAIKKEHIKDLKDSIITLNIKICSLAKKKEEVFLLNQKESIIFADNSIERALLQTIRDEAHRFAITYNRHSRTKHMKKNILESLPWFGPITRKKLLKEFKSVDNLKNISEKDVFKICNISQIETLKDHWLLW